MPIPEIDEFDDGTADEACAAVLNTRTADEAARPSSVEEDEDYEYESDSDLEEYEEEQAGEADVEEEVCEEKTPQRDPSLTNGPPSCPSSEESEKVPPSNEVRFSYLRTSILLFISYWYM